MTHHTHTHLVGRTIQVSAWNNDGKDKRYHTMTIYDVQNQKDRGERQWVPRTHSLTVEVISKLNNFVL